MIEKAITSRLDGYAGLSALISTRIYPLKLPQDSTMPAVVYQIVSKTRESAMGSDPGLATARVRISSFADSYSSAKDVGEQVRAALQRWSGTEATVVIQDSFIEMDIEQYDPEVKKTFVIQDYKITFEE